MMTAEKRRNILIAVLCVFIIQFFCMNSHAHAATSAPTSTKTVSIVAPAAVIASASAMASGGGSTGGGSTGGGSGTTTPDLFTGTLSYSIPIDVAPGRKGMAPSLALTYQSNGGNGWVGVGWDLEVGAIERSTKNGVSYDGDEFVLRIGGSSIDLVHITVDEFNNNLTTITDYDEYRSKIESSFSRIRKYKDTAGKILYWEVTDRSGTKYWYGYTSASRQDDPADANRVFKWCLDKVEDTNGNYTTVSYEKTPEGKPYEGEIYLKQIDYTGNYVHFYLESRTDAPVMNTTNFAVKTAYRLKTIEVRGNGYAVRAYKLTYGSSSSTARSLLASVQQFGKDASVDTTNGNIINEATTSKLPPIQLTTSAGTNSFSEQVWTTNAPNWGDAAHTWVGDFDGDGKTDIATEVGGTIYVKHFNGGTFVEEIWIANAILSTSGYTRVGDFNGDGKMDIATAVGGTIYVLRSTGSSFVEETWTTTAPNWGAAEYTWVGDFNGDGKNDIATASGGTIWVKRSYQDPSTGMFSFIEEQWTTTAPNWGASMMIWVGDFNGDGKSDIVTVICNMLTGQLPTIWIKRSTGSSFVEELWYQASSFSTIWPRIGYTFVGDFNGDGKTDIATVWPGATIWPFANILVCRSTGSSCIVEDWGVSPNWGGDGSVYGGYTWVGDFNNDGRADIATASGGTIWAKRSTGFSFIEETWTTTASNWGANEYTWAGDFNGDGKADIATASGGTIWVKQSNVFPADLLTGISNGLGGTTTIEYRLSTQYPIPQPELPFPIQTVYSITTNDGNGNIATTTYDYQGGYYHVGEKDFRGFNHVTVTGPDDNGKRTISETWFHQGNDTAVDVNDPSGHDGYMKGKPYRTRVKDEQGKVYSETTTTYLSSASVPYFNPPIQMDGYSCEGVLSSCANDASAKHTQTVLTYTYIGNVTREDHYGDLSDANDNYTAIRNFSPNSTAWIFGLPTNETIYQGTYPGVDAANLDPTKKVANTTFYYDGVTDCNTASTNQTPTSGNLTRIVRWLDGINDPSVRMAYDNYGNLSCTRDAKGNVSTVSYDGSFTFPTASVNALGQKTSTQYYGVEDVAADKGLYGQVQSVSDPNSTVANPIVTTMEYDTFGRKKSVTAPDGTWTAWSYNNFGTVGLQHVKVDTAAGLSSWTYFDGLGRTITAKKTGPDNKVIATQTQYNPTGTVAQTSLPYFENANETVRMTVFTYDSLGRVTSITTPDTATVQSCYNNLVTGFIDAEQHLKRETKNTQGKLIKVEEFTGTYASCTATVGNPYAVTTYDYDVLGNLRFVTDNAKNKTEIHYDNLGRKDYMRDPDMGYWTYAYDANGNLTKQTDARGQIITFTYDSLNRVTKKHYPRLTFGPDVVYTYDVSPASYPTYTTYPIGRLTTMTDASGTTTLFYDNMGRTTKTIKTIAGTDYPAGFAYTLGRPTSVTYPDGDMVSYSYDNGGNLIEVIDPSTNKAYVTYANFNALAQPGIVTYGNGVTTTYQYYPTNNRLMDITTLDPTSQKLLGLTYYYSDGGNVKAIADNMDSTRSQTFTYDDINRLIQAQSMSYGTQSYSYDQIGNIMSKEGVSYTYTDSNGAVTRPHAVKSTTDGKTYTYDANGNMISTGVQSINYDYDNMPRSVNMNNATTTFVYDGGGARVKKTTASGTTIYIGKLYECNGSACSKYIMAGGTRIALKSGTDTLYYHQDHLGSSRIVTNKDGNRVEEAHYLPFGAAQSDTGTVSVNHKYTSQEFDAETGLYYYNARYYNPVLGRFISPDSVGQNISDPQTLNRYSYVRNNPLIYTDPSGHRHWRRIFREAVHFAVNPYWGMKDVNDRLLLKYPKLAIAEGVAVGIAAAPLGPWASAGASAAFSAYTTNLYGGGFNDIMKSVAIGAASGAAGSVAGNYVRGLDYGRYVIAGTSGMVSGATSSALRGGNIAQGALIGGVTGVAVAELSRLITPVLRSSMSSSAYTPDDSGAGESQAGAPAGNSNSGPLNVAPANNPPAESRSSYDIGKFVTGAVMTGQAALNVATGGVLLVIAYVECESVIGVISAVHTASAGFGFLIAGGVEGYHGIKFMNESGVLE